MGFGLCLLYLVLDSACEEAITAEDEVTNIGCAADVGLAAV